MFSFPYIIKFYYVFNHYNLEVFKYDKMSINKHNLTKSTKINHDLIVYILNADITQTHITKCANTNTYSEVGYCPIDISIHNIQLVKRLEISICSMIN